MLIPEANYGRQEEQMCTSALQMHGGRRQQILRRVLRRTSENGGSFVRMPPSEQRFESVRALHSYRKATSGSTREARRAGTAHAASATAIRSAETETYANRLLAAVPNRRLAINLVAPKAPARPNPTPASARTTL